MRAKKSGSISSSGTNSVISIVRTPSARTDSKSSSRERTNSPFADLVRLDDLVVRDRLALLLADLLVADRAAVGLVDQVEVERVLAHRRVEPDGTLTRPKEIVPLQSARGMDSRRTPTENGKTLVFESCSD